MRSYTVKENHIDSAISKIPRYRQTHKYPVTSTKGLYFSTFKNFFLKSLRRINVSFNWPELFDLFNDCMISLAREEFCPTNIPQIKGIHLKLNLFKTNILNIHYNYKLFCLLFLWSRNITLNQKIIYLDAIIDRQ